MDASGVRLARTDGPTPLSLRALTEITRSVAAQVGAGAHGVEFNSRERRARRLWEDGYTDVWLISWTYDQSTQLHDHAGSLGALTVVRGMVTERYWAPATEPAGRPGLRQRDLPTSRTIGFPVGHVHDVVNTRLAPAVTVHAYSPPLTAMGYYEVDDTSALRRVHTILTDNPEPDARTSPPRTDADQPADPVRTA